MSEVTLTKQYEPEKFETALYDAWEKAGAFRASDVSAPGQEAFSLSIPPPNITGALHMGHGLTFTIEDILVRWQRMRGANTLWMPGTDHASIATQNVVEKVIAKEGKNARGLPLTRHDLGREKFLERVWKWKHESGSQITRQLRRLGASLDWPRERFTMDPGMNRAVREAFVCLYEDGLIFRGERITNWCPRCHTALSDLEVIPTDRKGSLYKIRYVRADDPNQSLVVATTRPETLLGDTAVAVHPEDERYQSFVGKQVLLPLLKKPIPVIADSYVEREFGTGALKVTPAHDFNDFELGKKHDLPMVMVMGKDGRIGPAGGPYAGLKFEEARTRILTDLSDQGLLVGSEPHAHKVGLCQRCDQTAEPLVSMQWFVDAKTLAAPALEAVKSGRVTITPESWTKTYYEWMENIRDWCISRQLWWGHQIPAWHCADCGKVTIDREDPKNCAHCKSSSIKQDEDVLDTWFSAGLWPFATLGWPEKTAALKTFYPNAVMETGFDILFFWVARMMMFGIKFTGEPPFKKIYLHAMVRDEKGQKMSKSKGNVIDPLEVIDAHGADPLRLTLAIMAGQGRDIKLSVSRVEGYRAFCNKLWNSVQFLLFQVRETSVAAPAGGAAEWVKKAPRLRPFEEWMLSRLEHAKGQALHGLENFELNVTAQSLYDFVWHEVCDWGIELTKLEVRQGRSESLYVLHAVIEEALKLLHPIIPHVTEQLWQALPWRGAGTSAPGTWLMLQKYPERQPTRVKPEAEQRFAVLQMFASELRKFRGENNIAPSQEIGVHVRPEVEKTELKNWLHEVESLARVKIRSGSGADQDTVIPLPEMGLELRIPLAGIVDPEAEKARVQKEIQNTRAEIDRLEKKLGNEGFVARAPQEVVEGERKKLAEMKTKLSKLGEKG